MEISQNTNRNGLFSHKRNQYQSVFIIAYSDMLEHKKDTLQIQVVDFKYISLSYSFLTEEGSKT